MFPGFDLHEAYGECDVFVSIAKMKEHATCGVTPFHEELLRVYAHLHLRRPGPVWMSPRPSPRAAADRCHSGDRMPSKSAPQPRPTASNHGGFRVPRIVADVVAARPH